MDRDSKYGLIAVSVLLVSGAVFGSYSYLANRTIEASSNQAADFVGRGVPLKAGWNDFTNGKWSITTDSAIVGINGSLMSVSDATERGIISQITAEDGKLVLGQNAVEIAAEMKFAVNVTDTTNSPAIFIQTKE
jgi:hypothetical protein